MAKTAKYMKKSLTYDLPTTSQPDKRLGMFIRSVRTEGGFGSLDRFHALVGVAKSTLAAYEQGKLLPDVDFLARFAKVTGANFNELLRLRLACSKDEDARELAGRIGEPVQAVAGEPLDRDLLREIIEGVEEGLRQAGRTMTPEKKAQLILALYDLYSKERVKPNKDNVIQFVKAA